MSRSRKRVIILKKRDSLFGIILILHFLVAVFLWFLLDYFLFNDYEFPGERFIESSTRSIYLNLIQNKETDYQYYWKVLFGEDPNRFEKKTFFADIDFIDKNSFILNLRISSKQSDEIVINKDFTESVVLSFDSPIALDLIDKRILDRPSYFDDSYMKRYYIWKNSWVEFSIQCSIEEHEGFLVFDFGQLGRFRSEKLPTHTIYFQWIPPIRYYGELLENYSGAVSLDVKKKVIENA